MSAGSTVGLAPVFAALADDTRWTILARLGEAPASASALAREFPISRQAISKHLDVLREAGLVDTQSHGRELVHRALGGRLGEVARQLESIGLRLGCDAPAAAAEGSAVSPPPSRGTGRRPPR